MPANDFEKQAKQLLDEISIRPNAQVWNEVEKRIREKKRRRWFIILPLMAGLLLGGYYFIQQYGENNNNNKTIIASQSKIDRKEANTSSTNKKQEEPVSINKEKKSTADAAAINKEIVQKEKIINTNQQQKESVQKNVVVKEKRGKQELIVNSEKTKPVDVKKVKNNDVIIAPGKAATKTDIPVQEIIKANKQEETKVETVKQLNSDKDVNKTVVEENKDAEVKSIVDENVKQSTETKSDSVENKPGVVNVVVPADSTPAIVKTTADKRTKSVKSKWKLGVMLNAGVSNVSNKFFSLDLNKNNEDKALNINTNPAATYYYPSANYKSFGWQAGVFLQKNISKRSNISIGLNYALYQTKIKTGSFVYASNVQASNANYYSNVRPGNGAAAGSIDYHSKLHYLELPVSFSTKLTRSTKVPLYWNGGISMGLLMGSNYLHYDTASQGIYYKDNSLLRKTSLNLQTGFSFTLLAKSRTPLTVGPAVQFGVLDILKKDSEKRYILFGGLKMQMLLPGKKK
jgi:hypothetical protein